MSDSHPRDIAVLLPAAGRGQRFGSESNKLFASFKDRPLWRWTLDLFLSRRDVARIVMAIDPSDRQRFEKQIQSDPLLSQENPSQASLVLVDGGKERMDSVRMALASLEGDDSITLVAVHDAARPLVTDGEIDAVFDAARRSGAAFLGCPVSGSLHRRLGTSTASIDRRELFQAATPQVFSLDVFRNAYQKHKGRAATDDVQLVQRSGHPVEVVVGRTDNIKITYPEDLGIAQAILINRQG
jgi:2-C-methyl-D-erythritol 4-phosphate cytidylyltransferase